MQIRKMAILMDFNDMAPYKVEAYHLDRIRETIPGAEIVFAKTEPELISKTDDADVFLTWGMYRPVEFCRKAKSLKWLHVLTAGLDGVMVPEITALDLRISSTKGIHGNPIGNHVLAYILSFLRCFPHFMEQQRNKIWKKKLENKPGEIDGKTVGILGYGRIGQVIAQQCRTLGLRVIAVDKIANPGNDPVRIYPPEELHSMLQEADFVVASMPLTEETRGIMGKKEFEAMKPSAIFINVGRGPLVDEKALIFALQQNVIAGAGLDVFEKEPLSEQNPLWEMPNVIITPHCSADSSEYMNRAIAVFCENAKRFLADEPLLYEADKALGY